jgi:hypothetical protein
MDNIFAAATNCAGPVAPCFALIAGLIYLRACFIALEVENLFIALCWCYLTRRTGQEVLGLAR